MAKSNIKKNAQGYGYNYTDLAEIHNYLEENGITYYQYIDVLDGVDYIMTVPIINGEPQEPRRGCRVIEFNANMGGGKQNIFQMYGSAISYLRRYSLMMCLGLASSDNDASCFTVQTISKVQAKSLLDLVKSKGLDEAWLFSKCGVSRLGEITEEQYAEIVQEMNLV